MKNYLYAAAVVLAASVPTFTAQASLNDVHQRHQKARDIRQDARTEARVEKRECYLKDHKSNRDCRRDKRDTKREGRRDARDTLWGNTSK